MATFAAARDAAIVVVGDGDVAATRQVKGEGAGWDDALLENVNANVDANVNANVNANVSANVK